jgi:hypothetical protein
MKLAKDKVSFKIRLAAFQASGDAEPRTLNLRTYTCMNLDSHSLPSNVRNPVSRRPENVL